MNGVKYIKVHNARIEYNLEFKRNISIIRGDSGTGKSTLIDMLTNKLVYKDRSTKLVANCNIKVLTPTTNWEEEVKKADGRALFIADEYVDYIESKDFMNTLKGSGNYLVYISRGESIYIDYSVESLFRMKAVKSGKRFINTLERVYNSIEKKITPEVIILEDSKVGKDVIEKASGIKCITSQGNGSINKEIIKSNNQSIYIIVDGAAFGRFIEEAVMLVQQKMEEGRDAGIFTPESFEWLCLNTSIIKSKDEKINYVLNNTEDYIDYRKCSSWEQFYTIFLKEVLKRYFNEIYTKFGKLPDIMRTERFLIEIKKQLKDLK